MSNIYLVKGSKCKKKEFSLVKTKKKIRMQNFVLIYFLPLKIKTSLLLFILKEKILNIYFYNRNP